MQAFERDLIPKAFDQETKLDARLRHFAEQQSRLVNLERINDEIARLQAGFAETLSRCEETDVSPRASTPAVGGAFTTRP